MAAGLSHCFTLRTFDDALAIRSRLSAGHRLAVIGGGFIGLELAAIATALGVEVTVLEAQTRILQRGVPAEIAAILHQAHTDHGVRILCGQAIASVTETARGVAIRLADGGLVELDLVVVGIGAKPNVELAEAAGLAIDNGIAVDDRLRTSDPHFPPQATAAPFRWRFTAGGVCGSKPGAMRWSRVRSLRLTCWAATSPHAAVPWFWSDQYDLGLQMAGLADEASDIVWRDTGGGGVLLFHLAADGRLLAASGMGSGASIGRDFKVAEMLIARQARAAARGVAIA